MRAVDTARREPRKKEAEVEAGGHKGAQAKILDAMLSDRGVTIDRVSSPAAARPSASAVNMDVGVGGAGQHQAPAHC